MADSFPGNVSALLQSGARTLAPRRAHVPSEERHGFIWAVLSAGSTIHLDAHLGDVGAELALWDYGTYGYHADREFSSEVSWKGALEAFAEGYHFPFVHGQSLIGQNTLANTMVYAEFGKHHRIGFPFNWITNLDQDPAGDWSPSANMGVSYWIYPNLILANSMVGVEIIDMLPEGEPTRCTVRHSWMGNVPAASDDMRAGYDAIYQAVHAAVRDEDFAMLPSAAKVYATASTIA